jgi:phytoene dehydrogenase-like protein
MSIQEKSFEGYSYRTSSRFGSRVQVSIGEGMVTVTGPRVGVFIYRLALTAEPERYEAEKKRVALTVIKQLEKRFPGFEGQVEVADVATPLTYERYTGNWQGSMEGWLITPETMDMMMGSKRMKKTLPGVENFYMIGQWVEPGGGLPPAAMSGRNVMQLICRRDGRPFVAQATQS